MSEKELRPVDILSQTYNELIEPKEADQTLADFITTLEEKDAVFCRIVTWYYKIFEDGYQCILPLGFNKEDNLMMLRNDLTTFGQKYEWPEFIKVAENIPNVIKHISEEPQPPEEKEGEKREKYLDDHDVWLDKLNDLNDEATDPFMESDELFYERILDYHNNF